MILSFGSKDTQRVFVGEMPRKLPFTILKRALLKLTLMDAALNVSELKEPPGNRLEKLSGDWKGYYSIRINDQWRIIFTWPEDGPEEVTIIDYH